MSFKVSKKQYRKILDDICQDEPCLANGEYCLLKEIILSTGLSKRTLLQLKCVEKFKYEQSERQGYDIGWEGAFSHWVDLKYADKFAKIYDEDEELSFIEIYKKIMKS